MLQPPAHYGRQKRAPVAQNAAKAAGRRHVSGQRGRKNGVRRSYNTLTPSFATEIFIILFLKKFEVKISTASLYENIQQIPLSRSINSVSLKSFTADRAVMIMLTVTAPHDNWPIFPPLLGGWHFSQITPRHLAWGRNKFSRLTSTLCAPLASPALECLALRRA